MTSSRVSHYDLATVLMNDAKEVTRLWEIKEIPKVAKPLKTFVTPGAFTTNIMELMRKAGYSITDNVNDAELVVFSGGADVNPALYDQKTLSVTYPSPARDRVEMDIYHHCRSNNIPMFGICRGAQFLHVMNGGKLWQDVDTHPYNHDIVDLEEKVRLTTNSLHHQMITTNDGLTVIAICPVQVARTFKSDGLTVQLDRSGANALREIEIEAGAYMDTRCFFVQGHPEIGSDSFKAWTMTKLRDLLVEWGYVEDTITTKTVSA